VRIFSKKEQRKITGKKYSVTISKDRPNKYETFLPTTTRYNTVLSGKRCESNFICNPCKINFVLKMFVNELI
jgi:hypothetical protein